jgi:hypothetical protein
MRICLECFCHAGVTLACVCVHGRSAVCGVSLLVQTGRLARLHAHTEGVDALAHMHTHAHTHTHTHTQLCSSYRWKFCGNLGGNEALQNKLFYTCEVCVCD